MPKKILHFQINKFVNDEEKLQITNEIKNNLSRGYIITDPTVNVKVLTVDTSLLDAIESTSLSFDFGIDETN